MTHTIKSGWPLQRGQGLDFRVWDVGQKGKNMPRKKTIDQDKIRLEQIDSTIIEQKNCLQAELVFEAEFFTSLQQHTLQSYYKFEIDKDHNRLTVNTANSWKGLIMVFLSLVYVKYGTRIVGKLFRVGQYAKYTLATTDFAQAQCETPYLDERIELVAAPPSWKACYVRGNYESADIKQSIRNFEKVLCLDSKSSYITTQYASVVPHQYRYRPITQPVDNSGLLCCYLKDHQGAACAEGLAFVSATTFDKLFGERLVQGFSSVISPNRLSEIMESEDDPMRPIPLYAYEITPETMSVLCSYFPFAKDLIQASAKEEPGSFIIFDRKHLGKWG